MEDPKAGEREYNVIPSCNESDVAAVEKVTVDRKLSSHEIEACRILNFTLISAKGLKDVCMFGDMSPYAVVWINPDEKYSTQVAHNAGCSPVWNHRFLLSLPDAANEDSCLSIQVLSHGHLADTLVGSVSIPLSDITHGNTDTVQYMACQLQRPSGRIQGLLNLSVQTSDGSSLGSYATTSGVEGCSSKFNFHHRDPAEIDEEKYQLKVGSEPRTNEPSSSDPLTGHTALLPSMKHYQAGAYKAAPDILDSMESEVPAFPHVHHSHIRHTSPHHSTGGPESGDSGQPGDHSDPTGLGFGNGLPSGALGSYFLAEAGSAAIYNNDGSPSGGGTPPNS